MAEHLITFSISTNNELLTGIYSPISSVISCGFSWYFSTSSTVFLKEIVSARYNTRQLNLVPPEDWQSQATLASKVKLANLGTNGIATAGNQGNGSIYAANQLTRKCSISTSVYYFAKARELKKAVLPIQAKIKGFMTHGHVVEGDILLLQPKGLKFQSSSSCSIMFCISSNFKQGATAHPHFTAFITMCTWISTYFG